MPQFNRPEQKALRQQLRKNATYSEQQLWKVLRRANLDGRKFRRQHGIPNFVVDFYCAEERLVIEIDGDVHEEKQVATNDQYRDEKLRSWGYTVMRFSNEEVIGDCDGVCERIREQWKGRER